MEFELEGDEIVEAMGDIEVTLPPYVLMLSQEELAEAKRSAYKHKLIIAAGRQKPDDDIIVMTATGRLLLLRAATHGLPPGESYPIDFGMAVGIGRVGSYEMAADWVIANAEPLGIELLNASTYGDENPPG